MSNRDNDRTIEALITELQELRLRVARLEETQGRHSETGSRTGSSITGAPQERFDVAVGDRIRVTNRVRRPANRPSTGQWDEEKEKVGTVTKIIGDQVHYVTDNGTHTWRAPNNLKRTN